MKRMQSMLGVTLLEIMLVLAIAAMIIVMSVRYYQSANISQQAGAILTQIQAITAAGDSLAQGADYNRVTTAAVTTIVPANGMTAPWGGAITIGQATATQYPVTIANMPAGVCNLLTPKLQSNTRFTNITACGDGAQEFGYTYDATR